MSNREKAINIINQIPEYKLTYVLEVLNGIKGLIIDEVNPDEWDLKMMKESDEMNDGTAVSFDEMLEKDGLAENQSKIQSCFKVTVQSGCHALHCMTFMRNSLTNNIIHHIILEIT